MMNKLLIALTLLAACVTASADALKEHLWKHRVILSFSANKSSQERLLLMRQIEQYRCEFSSRDLIHLDLIADSDDYLQLSQRFSVKNKDFQLVLLGKDGEVKLDTKNPSLRAVFDLIDTMPMRQREQREDEC